MAWSQRTLSSVAPISKFFFGHLELVIRVLKIAGNHVSDQFTSCKFDVNSLGTPGLFVAMDRGNPS
jgi:hypothetical protein